MKVRTDSTGLLRLSNPDPSPSTTSVLADLNILQQQQIESDQRLKQARLLKQRRLEQQTNLEKALQPTSQMKDCVEPSIGKDHPSTVHVQIMGIHLETERKGCGTQKTHGGPEFGGKHQYQSGIHDKGRNATDRETTELKGGGSNDRTVCASIGGHGNQTRFGASSRGSIDNETGRGIDKSSDGTKNTDRCEGGDHNVQTQHDFLVSQLSATYEYLTYSVASNGVSTKLPLMRIHNL